MERAKVLLWHVDLRELLNLPQDIEIFGLKVDNDPVRLEVQLYSPGRFMHVHPNCESPVVPLSAVQRQPVSSA